MNFVYKLYTTDTVIRMLYMSGRCNGRVRVYTTIYVREAASGKSLSQL